MNLIIWRHAEAEETAPDGDDLARPLTARGHKQAKRMARWLDNVLPSGVRVLCSPVQRAVQTADALGRKFKLRDELAPNGTVAQLIELVQWPQAKPTFLIIGHQPVLGQLVAHVLGLQRKDCAIKKGAAWWIQHRAGLDGASQVQLVAVMSPELL